MHDDDMEDMEDTHPDDHLDFIDMSWMFKAKVKEPKPLPTTLKVTKHDHQMLATCGISWEES